MVDPSKNFLAPTHPFVPIPPYEWATVPFFFEEFYSIMKLSHSLSDILGHFGHFQVACCQGLSVEELLESPI